MRTPPHSVMPEDYEYGSNNTAVSRDNFIIWKTSAGRCSKERKHNTWRAWKLVKSDEKGRYGDIGTIGKLRLPKRFIGKRICIRIEVIKDDTPK